MDLTGVVLLGLVGLLCWPVVVWQTVKHKFQGKQLPCLLLVFLQLPLFGLLTASIVPKLLPWVILAPIFAFYHYLINLERYWTFFAPIAYVAFATAAIVFLGLIFVRYRIRCWMPTFIAVAMFAVFWTGGEMRTRFLQDAAIAKWSFDCVSKKSFVHSLNIGGEEFQFDLHTSAMKDGKSYGWSFKTLDFYEIPQSVLSNISPVC
jgi:hypothetical protein